jgi:hypothetical protein
MTNRRLYAITLWMLAAAFAGAAANSLNRTAPSSAAAATSDSAWLASSRPLVLLSKEILLAESVALADRNPFRLERSPTNQRYSLSLPAEAGPEPSNVVEGIGEATVFPAVAVSGIVGGETGRVMLEGFPGKERGFILGVGDEEAGIRLEWIRGDTVALSTSDTAWTLVLKRPWG